MDSNASQKGSTVRPTADVRPAEPTIISLNRAFGYTCDNVFVRVSAGSVNPSGIPGGQTHDQAIASLEAEMASHKALPGVESSGTDFSKVGSQFKQLP
ncbi:hypothetical protein ACHAPA_009996 [Fusarium lateritium]